MDGKRMPMVWINCAMSLDGKLAFAGGRRASLSGPRDMERVQRARRASDAVLVGVGTVIRDDPSLKVHWELLGRAPGRHKGPIRVVIDSRGRTPPWSRIMDGSAPTAIITAKSCKRAFPGFVRHASFGGREVDLRSAINWMRTELGVRRLMVEGGSRIITSLLHEGLVDRMTVFVAPVMIGGRTAPPLVGGAECRGERSMVRLRLRSARRIDGGILLDLERAGVDVG